jgi:catechol 2,3-dioxygenase-like lactoylglutathione lyase family enzyme
MPRGLDHIVHAVRDLDAAADFYRRLGFIVGARNRHDWGTHNHVVQLPGFFIELLTLAEPDKLGKDGLSRLFGAFNQAFLREHEGFSFLMLESADAAADAAQFKQAGIAASDALRFERAGKRPDGAEIKVAFSLAFARDPLAPDCGFAVCQQHFPENFWNPAFQAHPNGVSAVAGIVMVADNPSDHHIFLSAFANERVLHSTSNGISLQTPRGRIEIMTPVAYRKSFDCEPPGLAGGARIAALRFFVREPGGMEAVLREAGLKARDHLGRLVVGPDLAFGAALVFEGE